MKTKQETLSPRGRQFSRGSRWLTRFAEICPETHVITNLANLTKFRSQFADGKFDEYSEFGEDGKFVDTSLFEGQDSSE